MKYCVDGINANPLFFIAAVSCPVPYACRLFDKKESALAMGNVRSKLENKGGKKLENGWRE